MRFYLVSVLAAHIGLALALPTLEARLYSGPPVPLSAAEAKTLFANAIDFTAAATCVRPSTGWVCGRACSIARSGPDLARRVQ